MGMTDKQLALVKAIAENNLADAKKYAMMCCEEDATQKNAPYVARCKKLLEQSPAFAEMPYKIRGMAQMEDVSCFREDRYYLSEREEKLFVKISSMNVAGLKLMEMGIPYLNAVLLTGVSGTGKTTFGRYAAHKLGLPFLYINFSYLIDSAMGKTAQNLREVFDFARMNKCLLMLDEIDCIAQSRKGAGEGVAREHNNTTVTLLQELDRIQNDSIIIGATNIPNAVDPAVKRRFAVTHEVLPLAKEECIALMCQYLASTGLDYEEKEIISAADRLCAEHKTMPQAVILNCLIERIADAVVNGSNMVVLQ